MSTVRYDGYAVIERRRTGARSLSVMVAGPTGRRSVLQVPWHRSGPDGVLAALRAAETAERGHQGHR